GWIEPTKKEVVGDSFPPLEPFEFIDAQLVETETEAAFPPPLQTEEFTVITLEQDAEYVCRTLSNKVIEGLLEWAEKQLQFLSQPAEHR
ncbi:MAG: hypothetical protein AAFR25_11385, partial [Cyanobacteria bacterium J06629_19]